MCGLCLPDAFAFAVCLWGGGVNQVPPVCCVILYALPPLSAFPRLFAVLLVCCLAAVTVSELVVLIACTHLERNGVVPYTGEHTARTQTGEHTAHSTHTDAYSQPHVLVGAMAFEVYNKFVVGSSLVLDNCSSTVLQGVHPLLHTPSPPLPPTPPAQHTLSLPLRCWPHPQTQ